MMPTKVLLAAAVLLSSCHLYTDLDPLRSQGDPDMDVSTLDAAHDTATNADSGRDADDTPDADADMVEARGPWLVVASGMEHSCALTLDGTAYCWGAGDNLQLGNGARDNVPVPG